MRALLIAIGVMITGCASLDTQLPPIDLDALRQERSFQLSTAWSKYTTQNARLQSVADRVLLANADLCSKSAPQPAGQAMKLKDFPKVLRDEAKAFGFDETPRVLFARNATTALGDTLPENLSSEAPKICNYPMRLIYSPAVNAYATGRQIKVTTGMMAFADDDELAIIIGHELGHNEEGHVRKILTNRILGLGSGRFTRQFESEADYVGLYYAARAGFDIGKAPALWRRIGARSLKSVDKPRSHPTTPERFLRLGAALEEIHHKKTTGQALLPERKAE